MDSILLGNVGFSMLRLLQAMLGNTSQPQPGAPDTSCILRGISNATGKVWKHWVTVIFLVASCQIGFTFGDT